MAKIFYDRFKAAAFLGLGAPRVLEAAKRRGLLLEDVRLQDNLAAREIPRPRALLRRTRCRQAYGALFRDTSGCPVEQI